MADVALLGEDGADAVFEELDAGGGVAGSILRGCRKKDSARQEGSQRECQT